MLTYSVLNKYYCKKKKKKKKKKKLKKANNKLHKVNNKMHLNEDCLCLRVQFNLVSTRVVTV